MSRRLFAATAGLLVLVLPALLAATSLHGQQRPPTAAPAARTATFARALLATTHRADDPPAAVAAGAFLDLVEAWRDSPLGELPLRALAERNDLLAAPAALSARLRALLAGGGCHGLVDLAARRLLDEVDTRLGHDRDDAWSPLHGYVLDWSAIGPFGNLGDFYLDTVFPPELRFPAPGQAVAGRFGPISPRPVAPTTAGDPEIDLRDPRVDGGGCFYGRAVVALDAPVSGWVELETRGSLRLWIDGVEAARLDRTAARDGTRRWFPMSLAAGRHVLLVKTGMTQQSRFTLRFVDARGHALDAVRPLPADSTVSVGPAVATAELPAAPAGGFPDAVALLARAGGSADPDRATRIVATQAAFDADADDLGQRLLAAAEAALGTDSDEDWSVAERIALADCFTQAPDLPAEIAQARARALIEAAHAEGPKHATAVLRRARLLQQDDDLEGRVRLLTAAVESNPGGPGLRAALAEAWSDLGDPGRAQRLREELLADHPEDRRTRLALATERLRAGDFPGARALCAAGLRLLPGEPAFLDLCRVLAARQGDVAAASALLERRLRDELRETVALRRRAETAEASGDRAAATALWQRLADHPEADTEDLADAAEALSRAGQFDLSRTLWQRLLERDPGRHAIRRQLALLDGAPADPFLAAFRSSATDVESLVRDFAAGERERSAGSTLVLDRTTARLLPDGSFVEEIHQVRRINDQTGVAGHEQQEAAARADRVLRLRTLRADGSSAVPKRVAGSYSMPGLEPGVFVEALYQLDADGPSGGPVRGPEFYFQGADEPYVLSELLLAVPADLQGSLRTRNLEPAALQPLPFRMDGWSAVRIARHDMPRLRSERFGPPLEERAPYATFGADAPLDALPRTLAAVSELRSLPSPWVERATETVCAGVEGDRARLDAIHRYVHELVEAERGSPDPTEILLRRQGPRFFLEVAMLETAGVPLRHAGVARQAERFDDDVPSVFEGEDQYPIPAARVEPRDGAPVWLFADAPRYAPPGFVPGARGEAAYLMAADGTLGRLPAASPEGIEGWDVTGRAVAHPDGSVMLETTPHLRGPPGFALADQVRDLEANRRGLAARQLGARLFNGWQVQSADLAAPAPGQRFALQLALSRARAIERDGALRRVPLPLPPSEMQSRYGDRPDRDQDFVLRAASREEWQIRLAVPAGWQLAETPPTLRIRRPGCDYQLAVELDGDELVIRRHLRLDCARYEPSAFGAWLALCARIDRAESQGLAFAVDG